MTRVGSAGYVRLVDVLGDDWRICDAARVSFDNDGGEVDPEKDRNLIRFLMRHRHTSPFEQCELVFVVQAPMDVWRQWIRHRTASVNEVSTRYTSPIDATAETGAAEWRLQSADNKQGSDGLLDPEVGVSLSEQEQAFHDRAREVYRGRVRLGVAREQARKDLPLSTYTRAYWKIDLHNLFHFLELRLHSHAQKEIREFAEAIEVHVARHFPVAWEAFRDYRLGSVSLTGPEIEVLQSRILIDDDEDLDDLEEDALAAGLSDREVRELRTKVRRLGGVS